MQLVDFRKTDITDGFWQKKVDLVSEVSVFNVYKRFKETGRFDALSCNWKKGDRNEPHIFWDSDIAKWIESVAFILEKRKNPELEKYVDEAINTIADNQEECGYFNSCYQVHDKPRWSDRTDHELYCAGHFVEAAVAYYRATGKRKLLDVMEKYLEYIRIVFMENKSASFITPGHEEIELALIKLYELTDNKKYLEMCSFFIDNRGNETDVEYPGVAHKYSQSHLPVRQQKTAEGHCVRACYLYTAMSDLARITGDADLLDSCKSIFNDIAERKMYITGGIGSSGRGEAFTIPYDFPDLTAYSESCAALSLAWFAQRMLLIENDSKYADVIERILYNNALSSISLDGKAFFYVNPLAIRTYLLNRNTSQENTSEWLPQTQRKEVFDCSCCPPNITRFIASVADFLYTCDKNTLYVHQYINSSTETDKFTVSQKTDYPNNGTVEIKAEGVGTVALRIPGWCDNYSVSVDGKEIVPEIINGYVYIRNNGSVINLELDISPFIVYPSSKIRDYIGRAAVQRGPVVYCAEGVRNDFNIMTFRLDRKTDFSEILCETCGSYMLVANGKIPVESDRLYSRDAEQFTDAEIKLVPYYAFANHGESDMEVFMYYY
ncbi:MAG: glycoside hydrolase family 127 protein [Clostridia bacterium]|nr:glycoside hydrolase family 127 protein [Clostridia bacterium]